MKQNTFIACLAAFALCSCSDFLDVQPEGNNTADKYFNNDQQSIDAVTGLYKQLKNVYDRDIFWEQAGANDVVWGRARGFNPLATMTYTGDESPLKTIYDKFNQIISYSNWDIDKLLRKQKQGTLSAIETRSLGECYFMRGWMHFMLAYRYGTDKQGVPFVRYEDFENGYDNSIPKQQASVVDNYKMIIEDLDNAIKNLPKFEEYKDADKGRAHKAAAVALKAKVYAYWATWDADQWNNVITMVNSLENDYGRGLAKSLDEVFSCDYADFWNKEYIWSLPSDGGDYGSGTAFPGVVLEDKAWGIYNGWGQNKPTEDIYQEMAKDGEGNARLKRSILSYGDEFTFWGEKRKFYSTADFESGFQINKYMEAFKYPNADKAGYVNTNGDNPTARINFPLIRFAEMLLFRAEAYIMTGQAEKAKADINAIRIRSGLKPLDHTPTMADLYHERRCELAFEFTDHLFDLKRWHRSTDATIKALAEKELSNDPQVRHYAERGDANSTYTVGPYLDYHGKAKYDDHLMVFPYPSVVVTQSQGQLKQNEGY